MHSVPHRLCSLVVLHISMSSISLSFPLCRAIPLYRMPSISTGNSALLSIVFFVVLAATAILYLISLHSLRSAYAPTAFSTHYGRARLRMPCCTHEFVSPASIALTHRKSTLVCGIRFLSRLSTYLCRSTSPHVQERRDFFVHVRCHRLRCLIGGGTHAIIGSFNYYCLFISIYFYSQFIIIQFPLIYYYCFCTAGCFCGCLAHTSTPYH